MFPAMRERFVPLVSAALALSACATTTPAAAPTAPVASTPAPQSTSGNGPIARFARGAGATGAPIADVERALGAPDLRRQEGAGAILTYRLETCALMLVFTNGEGGLRLAEAHTGPRRAGQTPPSVEQCDSEFAARRRS